MNIVNYNFSVNQYNRVEHDKVQIYLHHTAGNSDPYDVYKFWEGNRERIATCVVIGGKPVKGSKYRDGDIIQGFGSRFWSFHLGLKESTFDRFDLPYRSLDKTSIGIEICNWGQLTYKNGKFYNYVNRVVPSGEVIELDEEFRGFKFFHVYTDAQIESVRDLLVYWRDKYNIPLDYNEDIWDVCPRALRGERGVFTHNSVRFDKIDVVPQPKLVEMLKSLG